MQVSRQYDWLLCNLSTVPGRMLHHGVERNSSQDFKASNGKYFGRGDK